MNGDSDNSFEAINYSLRPNKVIARKTIFDFLKQLDGQLGLRNYRYIGMGSLWFVDFMLAHRSLGIKKLFSIEADDVGHARAEFNAPLKCIDVLHGYTTDVLPEMNLDRTKAIIWLDHDTAVEGPAFKDISILVDNCKSGSVFLFTVNADVKRVRKAIEPAAPFDVTPEQIRKYLADKMGDVVPPSLTEADVDDDGYPKLVRSLMVTTIESALRRSARKVSFKKLFDFAYRDGPPMATVGGLLADDDTITHVSAIAEIAKWPGLIAETIQAPPLTLREKMKFDQLLPSARKFSERTFKSAAGFPLTEKQIVAYVDYYSLYPTFAELQL